MRYVLCNNNNLANVCDDVCSADTMIKVELFHFSLPTKLPPGRRFFDWLDDVTSTGSPFARFHGEPAGHPTNEITIWNLRHSTESWLGIRDYRIMFAYVMTTELNEVLIQRTTRTAYTIPLFSSSTSSHHASFGKDDVSISWELRRLLLLSCSYCVSLYVGLPVASLPACSAVACLMVYSPSPLQPWKVGNGNEVTLCSIIPKCLHRRYGN